MKARTNQWFSILLINGVSLLETELGNRKTNHVMLVYCHAPPRQEMKDCHRPRDAGTAVGPHAMAHVLAMADGGEPRQHRFDQHARVPGATRTDFHVAGIARLRMETCIRQDDHLAVKLGKQRLQRRIMDMGRGTIPGPDQAPLVQDKTQLPPDNPPRIAVAFLATLRWATPFPHGVHQLNPGGVRDATHRGCGQKAGGPCRVGLEEPGQTGALRHLRKQRQIIARQPAVEGAGPAAFHGMEQGQRHDFTGIHLSVRVFRHLQPLLVHRVEQCDNEIWGSHRMGSSRLKSSQPQLEPVHDSLSIPTLDVTYQTNTIGYYPLLISFVEPRTRTPPCCPRCRRLHGDLTWYDPQVMRAYNCLRTKHFHGGIMALHQKSFLYRTFWNKNRPLWSRKSLQNETKKVLLTGESAY